jgi:hypothetical protein
MVRRVALVRTDISGELISSVIRMAFVKTEVLEERIPSFVRVTRIGELGTSAVTSNRIADSCHPDDGVDTFFQNVGSYKSHPDDGGDTILWNVGSYKFQTA